VVGRKTAKVLQIFLIMCIIVLTKDKRFSKLKTMQSGVLENSALSGLSNSVTIIPFHYQIKRHAL